MARNPTTFGAVLALWLAAPAGLAQAITLDLPGSARAAADRVEALTSYLLPIGAFANGQMQTRRSEGRLSQTAWRIDTPGLTTLQILAPLRAQLSEAGFRSLYECDTAECGGFDFRYGTSILPEPEMHVDLGDFRYFAAERGQEVISLIVSRSSTAGFVQMTHVGGAADQGPVLSASTKTQPPVTAPGGTAPKVAAQPDPGANDIGARLMNGGAVALDDLVFASGSSSLTEGAYASLSRLAEWIKEHPTATIALVGHTDASGGLDANIALSRKRAESVRERLITKYALPPSQIEAQGVGYLSPRASNRTDEGRTQNRRVEVMLTSTQSDP